MGDGGVDIGLGEVDSGLDVDDRQAPFLGVLGGDGVDGVGQVGVVGQPEGDGRRLGDLVQGVCGARAEDHIDTSAVAGPALQGEALLGQGCAVRGDHHLQLHVVHGQVAGAVHTEVDGLALPEVGVFEIGRQNAGAVRGAPFAAVALGVGGAGRGAGGERPVCGAVRSARGGDVGDLDRPAHRVFDGLVWSQQAQLPARELEGEVGVVGAQTRCVVGPDHDVRPGLDGQIFQQVRIFGAADEQAPPVEVHGLVTRVEDLQPVCAAPQRVGHGKAVAGHELVDHEVFVHLGLSAIVAAALVSPVVTTARVVWRRGVSGGWGGGCRWRSPPAGRRGDHDEGDDREGGPWAAHGGILESRTRPGGDS